MWLVCDRWIVLCYMKQLLQFFIMEMLPCTSILCIILFDSIVISKTRNNQYFVIRIHRHCMPFQYLKGYDNHTFCDLLDYVNFSFGTYVYTCIFMEIHINCKSCYKRNHNCDILQTMQTLVKLVMIFPWLPASIEKTHKHIEPHRYGILLSPLNLVYQLHCSFAYHCRSRCCLKSPFWFSVGIFRIVSDNVWTQYSNSRS